MKKEQITKGEFKLVGLTVRTNNKNEMNAEKAKIMPTVMKYFHEQWGEEISHRKSPGITFCAYTDYESDHTGDYTFFIGEEVSKVENVVGALAMLVISPQTYDKFTTEKGAMPDTVIKGWQEIWSLYPAGKRNYLTDFELYDERASDYANAEVDIYIGVKG